MFGFCVLFGLVLKYAQGRTQISAGHADRRVSVDLARGRRVAAACSCPRKVNTHILEAVLFGSMLTVSDTDMNVLLVTAAVVVAVAMPLFNPHAARELQSEPRQRARRASRSCWSTCSC